MILDDVEMYEDHINMPVLYYDKESNTMFDADGVTIFEIFRYITPSTLRLFKEKKTWMVVRGVSGDPIELVYPEGPGVYPFK